MKLNHITVVASIKKHPLLWFYVISVLIEIVIIPVFYFTGAADALTSAMETSGIPFKTDLVTAFRVVLAVPSAFPGILLAIIQVAAVDIGVFIVARIAFGQAGIADLKTRFRFWKKEIPFQRALKIWGVCIVTFSLINLAAAGLNKLMFPGFFVWDVNFFPVHFLINLLITLFLDAGGLFEENGWRGFALPLLLQSFSPLKATVILGLLWGVWHFPVKFDLFNAFGFAGALIYLSAFTLRLTFVSILMTYFWNRLGQTTIVAIAMHGLINDSIGLGGRIESESFVPQLFTEVDLLIPTVIVAILVISQTQGKLGIRVNN
jgi:membrane protease YdiL (CAAX protease family)